MRTSFQIQRTVVYSLMLRELLTRFGKYRLGYIWALAEPVMHIVFFYSLFVMMGRHLQFADNLAVFLMTGIIPWFTFKNIVSRSVHVIDANIGLFSYRMIMPLDTVLARVVLETLIYSSAFVVLLFLASCMGFDVSVEDPLAVLALWITFILFSFAAGINLMLMVNKIPEIEKVTFVLFRVLYLLSGIFFTFDSLQPQLRVYFLINPLFHFIELFRSAYMVSFHSEHASLYYVFMSTLVLLFVGLAWYNKNKAELMVPRD